MKTKEEHLKSLDSKPATNSTIAELLLDIRELLEKLVGEKKK